MADKMTARLLAVARKTAHEAARISGGARGAAGAAALAVGALAIVAVSVAGAQERGDLRAQALAFERDGRSSASP